MPRSCFDVLELGLPLPQKAVLLALLKHVDADGRCFPSLATLATLTSQSERTVGRALNALEAAGYLTRQIRATNKGRSSTLYQLTDKLSSDFLQNDTVTTSNEKAVTDKQPQNDTVTTSKNDPIDYTAWQEFYNANKPNTWASTKAMNRHRQNKVKAFVNEHGRNHAFDLFKQGLRGAPKWWREKNFTFDTLFEKNHLIKWAELAEDDTPAFTPPPRSNDLTQILGDGYGHN